MEVIHIVPVGREIVEAIRNAARPRPPFILYVCPELLTYSQDYLWKRGRLGKEDLILWSGYPLDGGAAIASLVIPETESYDLHVRVRKEEQPRIVECLRDTHQLLFADVHTHPGSDTTLSGADRIYPVSYKVGFLSIIVPHYGEHALNLMECGIWERETQGWKLLRKDAVKKRFRIVSHDELCHVIERHD